MNKRIENKRIENKRIENNKARTFRSSTDVNNYNKFLLELDNQQIKENTIVYEKVNKSTNKTDFLYQNLYEIKLEFLH